MPATAPCGVSLPANSWGAPLWGRASNFVVPLVTKPLATYLVPSLFLYDARFDVSLHLHFLHPNNVIKNKQALFCRGEERHELWSFLLEKAFAKAHGCYENLMHGDTCDALRDLTGGVAEKLQWQLAASDSIAMSGQQAAPAKQPGIPLAGAGAATGGITATVGGAGMGLLRPRVAGWGVSAGTTPPLGWVFEEMRDRLLEGQVLGCRQVATHVRLCQYISLPRFECFVVLRSLLLVRLLWLVSNRGM